jgi:glycosyltransferase involved in cell wall biosynthesis
MAYMMKEENVFFVLAGSGAKMKEYREMVKEMRLEDKVLFVGWCDRMDLLYGMSDVLVLPSEGEGLPGVIMEAMTHGLPCVASRIPCIPELVEDGRTGYLCDKDDLKDFVNSIRILMYDKKRCRLFSKNSLEKIKSFVWKNVMKRYEVLYE